MSITLSLPLEPYRSSSPEIRYADVRAIRRHYKDTFKNINQKFNREVNATRTLRDGLTLLAWVGKVEEEEWSEVDRLSEYADEALEEACAKIGKGVAWSEVTEVKVIDRYIKIMEEDSDEEFYYEDDEEDHINFQNQLAAFPEPPLSAIPEDTRVDSSPNSPQQSDNTSSDIIEEIDRLINRLQDVFHTIPVPTQLRILNRFWASPVQENTSNDLSMVEERDDLINIVEEIFDSLPVATQRQFLTTILEQVEQEKRNQEYRLLTLAGEATMEDRASRTNRFNRQ